LCGGGVYICPIIVVVVFTLNFLQQLLSAQLLMETSFAIKDKDIHNAINIYSMVHIIIKKLQVL